MKWDANTPPENAQSALTMEIPFSAICFSKHSKSGSTDMVTLVFMDKDQDQETTGFFQKFFLFFFAIFFENNDKMK